MFVNEQVSTQNGRKNKIRLANTNFATVGYKAHTSRLMGLNNSNLM
jgi:hypothetical protein